MKTNVTPVGKKIMLDIAETSAGGIQVVQGAQIQEQGTIKAVGPDVPDSFKKGQLIQFKAWAVDIITIDKNKYYYIDCDSTAICGLVTLSEPSSKKPK